MQIDQEPTTGYAWESEYKRSWDSIKQDPTSGLLISSATEKRQRHLHLQETRQKALKVHRGLVRNVVIIIDASRNMAGTLCLLVIIGLFIVFRAGLQDASWRWK